MFYVCVASLLALAVVVETVVGPGLKAYLNGRTAADFQKLRDGLRKR